jgi:RNA polymerase sigma-70 factor (ECF subfamily)
MPPMRTGPDAATAPSDETLLRALVAEGAAALGPLYDRYAGLVYGLSRAILRDDDEAEDLTQEVFLELQRRGRYDPARGTLGTYLATMARSRALDRVRSRKRRGELLEEMGRDVPAAAPEPGPLERLSQDESARRTRAALAALPERHRRVLEMAYYDGLSQSEIAAALGAPLGTVKTWSRMGIQGLREALRDLVAETGEA